LEIELQIAICQGNGISTVVRRSATVPEHLGKLAKAYRRRRGCRQQLEVGQAWLVAALGHPVVGWGENSESNRSTQFREKKTGIRPERRTVWWNYLDGSRFRTEQTLEPSSDDDAQEQRS
jgi:hypothetical protein